MRKYNSEKEGTRQRHIEKQSNVRWTLMGDEPMERWMDVT